MSLFILKVHHENWWIDRSNRLNYMDKVYYRIFFSWVSIILVQSSPVQSHNSTYTLFIHLLRKKVLRNFNPNILHANPALATKIMKKRIG